MNNNINNNSKNNCNNSIFLNISKQVKIREYTLIS